MKRVPTPVKYNTRMTKRFFVRVPDQMWQAIVARAEQETERTGRLVEPGSVARDLMQAALEAEGAFANVRPVKRRAVG